MKFLDYEQIIRSNYPILIDSYVEQYGEEYREHIEKVLNKVKFCIFETPLNINNYVKTKIKEDFFKAILDGYIYLNIDISGIRIDEDGLVFSDKKIENLTNIFFPVIDVYEKVRTRGLFTFNDEFDNFDLDNPVFKERIDVLEKLNLKDKNILTEEYIKSEEYDYYCYILRGALSVFIDNIFYRCSMDYQSYYDYVDKLEETINEVALQHERKFLFEIRDFLCSEDQILLDSGADIKNLRDYYLYFDSSLSKGDYNFSDGSLVFFCDFYTDMLLSKHTSKVFKNEIIDFRMQYLKEKGFDVDILERDKLFCDWYQLESLRGFLPDLKLVSEILLKRDEIERLYRYEVCKLCIINDYDLHENDVCIETIFDSDGDSCTFDTNNFDCDNVVPIVCLSPLSEDYNLFDIVLDHELRHAIEMSIKNNGNSYIVKIGSDISEVNLDFDCIKSGYTDYNERVTQKLSVEACHKRWMKSQFIFSDPYAFITDYCSTCYDDDLDNLDIIFEPFRKELIRAQISDNYYDLYSIIPKSILRKINFNISKHSNANVSNLESIRDSLLKRKEETFIKVKKINNK